MAVQVDGSRQPSLASDVKVPKGSYGQNAPQASSVTKVTDSCDLSALKVTAPNDGALDHVRRDNHHNILSEDFEQLASPPDGSGARGAGHALDARSRQQRARRHHASAAGDQARF